MSIDIFLQKRYDQEYLAEALKKVLAIVIGEADVRILFSSTITGDRLFISENDRRLEKSLQALMKATLRSVELQNVA